MLLAKELLGPWRVRARNVIVVAALAVLWSSACGAKNPTAVSTTYTGSIAVENFRGTLALGGSIFYSFTVPRDGPISVTLLELQENGAPSDAAISLGLGNPVGTGCTTPLLVTASAGGTPQLTGEYAAGVYCTKVADVGNLSFPAQFNINIARPK